MRVMTGGVAALVVLLTSTMQGCYLGKTYREINPEDAELQVRKYNGYYVLKSVVEGESKVVLRSEGAPNSVNFAACYGESICTEYKNIGTVADGGHDILLPWIAELSNKGKPEFITIKPPPNQKIFIKGLGSWYTYGAQVSSSGSCGPLTSSFTPEASRNYLVQFIWKGDMCRQVISDATDPDNLKQLSP